MRIWWLILLLLVVPLATATDNGQLASDTIFNFSAIGVNITVLAPQNFSQIIVYNSTQTPADTLEFTINSSKIQFNGSTNQNLSKISFNNNIWNWTYTNSTEYLNVNASVLYQLNYTLYKEGIAQQTAFTSTLNLYYNLTSAGNYSIQSAATSQLLSPANNSVNINPSPVTFTWLSFPISDPNTIQIATDKDFLGIISTSTATSTTGTYTTSISLSQNTQYWWRVKTASSGYSFAYTFTTTIPTTVPGALNVTVKDEQTDAVINSFTTQLYNSTVVLTKNTTNGWTNWTSAEIASGQYLVRIIPTSQSVSTTITTSTTTGYVVNSSGGNTTYPNTSSTSSTSTSITSTGYASRSVLATSPTTVTVYLPSSSGTNVIDTVAFNLMDYSGKFSPTMGAYMVIIKNSSVMDSEYFQKDGKVATYLIRGDIYTISVYNSNTNYMQQWGNYVSVGSGTVPIVIMNIGVNETTYLPFASRITHTTNSIDLTWQDRNNIMSNLNYTIYKGNTSNLVYSLQTAVKTGATSYTITSNDTYYVFLNATTSLGQKKSSQVFDLTAGTKGIPGRPVPWIYGNFAIASWLQNAISIMFLVILGGSFGAMHRGEGSIITGIFSLLFWFWGWLTLTTAMAGYLGAIVFFAVLYHLESKRRQGAMP